MQASIFSQDNFKKDYGGGTRGKTFSVAASKFEIQIKNGVLTVIANEREDYCPQNIILSTTSIREIQRDLTVQFTAQEIKTILDAALAANLIQPSFAVAS